VAIDGSKFKAVNNRDKNFTRAKMERRMAQIEELRCLWRGGKAQDHGLLHLDPSAPAQGTDRRYREALLNRRR
jgi:hypothetical protein